MGKLRHNGSVVSKAAVLSDKATIRRRRLLGDLVLWLIVGMAFFRNGPIAEVARRMNVCAEGRPKPCLPRCLATRYLSYTMRGGR
ncbi:MULTISPECIES: transposase domain-containing protein [Vibrio]|uniref:transposase domain-containing protein n=1 Tax=Vibrio TaxID=662 RepID=UPI00207540C4|nr:MULTISPECIES: transposase domain-containing protein [unclassified Vibrio]USD34864.1 transposase domain-containing protein [Vibrio sp. SCSIO 43186]USD47929.1 transposase domain-containing protein [Vibrio sp. SCSIO 43145]USD71988.1 transposase domain-containing protein [Vibrio sp. SCSIO 43139]USD97657.1 hypothetical protein CTT30_16440 [Vibrio coralliilyticus]